MIRQCFDSRGLPCSFAIPMLRTMTAISRAGYILLIESKALQKGQAKVIMLLISIRMI